MPKAIFYAMDADYLRKYADFKDNISAERVNLSTDEIKRISAEIQSSRSSSRELYTVDDSGAAHIAVTGPLEPKPDPCAVMFDIDMTTYADIIDGTRKAEADDAVNKIIYDFDTPGGNVTGLFATADVIRKAEKPTVAVNHGLMASAGYALGSQCDSIECANISAETGSIGVVCEILDKSGLDAGQGVKRYVLTSENAENKRPDVTTSEGRDKIVNRLTALESVFIEYVASGRNATTETILDNFGHGAIFTAREARKVGMIDSIQSEINAVDRNATASEKTNKGEDAMEMTQEQIEKIAADAAERAATSATEKATASVRAEFEAKEKANSADVERRAGFAPLLSAYPNQKEMIETEMNKEGAAADAAFALKVDAAEKSRLAAEDEQSDGEDENPDVQGNDKPGENDQSGNELAAMLGLEVGV